MLHLQLDELIDSWRALADTVAERAIAIGVAPDGHSATVAPDNPLRRVDRGEIEDRIVVRELADRLAGVAERAPDWTRTTTGSSPKGPRPDVAGVRALYRKRQGMIEPVFGQTKLNRRIDRSGRSPGVSSAGDLAPAFDVKQAPDGSRSSAPITPPTTDNRSPPNLQSSRARVMIYAMLGSQGFPGEAIEFLRDLEAKSMSLHAIKRQRRHAGRRGGRRGGRLGDRRGHLDRDGELWLAGSFAL